MAAERRRIGDGFCGFPDSSGADLAGKHRG
jgi:hypothetical protein